MRNQPGRRAVARSRERIIRLQQIPNVGPRIAGDFHKLGLHHPHELAGRDPYELYARINAITGVRQDPCLLDTFIAAVRYMEGAPKRPWWHYTVERKRALASAPASSLHDPR
ncbi:MAG TPA: helix-hairpin-helix domain-containing protein [Gemmatimonadaceae bacterium]|jgi:hypothetical protein|nr:helix-hairpin-helix domain-containing protein [Gemmatimonadaceae bacterium]